MAFNTTINSTLLSTYLIKKFIPALEEDLQLQKFGARAVVPPGMGTTARWNTFPNPSAITTSLTEGTNTENPISLTTTSVEATIAEWGQFISETSIAKYAAAGPARQELVDRMTFGAALTLDSWVRTQALTTTVDFYTNASQQGGVATASDPTAASAAALMGARKLLRDAKATGIRGVAGHPDGHYAAVISPKAELDITTEATTGRITWQNAVVNVPGKMGQEKFVKGYIGSVYGVATYVSQNLTQTTITVTTGTLSDNNFVIADHGLGCLDFGDMKANIYINTASSGDIGNPYRNSNTIAWHAFFAAKLLDANRVVRLYTAA